MEIRRVAVFHNTAQVGSAWSCAEGIVTSLAKRGFEVLNCGHPRDTNVTLATLQTVDLIMLGAPEWFDQVLLQRYGQGWRQLKATKVAWYAESAHRDDRSFDLARCREVADLHYFPAIQDAEEFGGEWLPFGADTSLFFPMPIAKLHEAAFLGTLYPKRIEYIKGITAPITLLPPVHADNPVKSVLLLAEAYNATKIFVNMPSYSRLLVTKVSEVMACGTMLITPAIDHPSGLRNMSQFENGKHLVYYDQNKPAELAELVQYYRDHSQERETIAQAGLEEVTKRHTLEQRVMKIVQDATTYAREIRIGV